MLMVDRAHAARQRNKKEKPRHVFTPSRNLIARLLERGKGVGQAKSPSRVGAHDKTIPYRGSFDIITNNGVVAHLVERSIRIAEVGSSSLPDSTKSFL